MPRDVASGQIQSEAARCGSEDNYIQKEEVKNDVWT